MPEPLVAPVAHAVPILVRSRRGGRPRIARDHVVTPATIPGADRDEFTPARLFVGTFSMDVLRRGDRIWQQVARSSSHMSSPVVMGLDEALVELSVPIAQRTRIEEPGQAHGLAGPPFQALVTEYLRVSSPDRASPEEREAGLLLARAALAAFASEELLHDGRHLYRAARIPLVLPRPTPSLQDGLLWADLDIPGVLHTRIPHPDPTGRSFFPHTRKHGGVVAYGQNLEFYRTQLAASLKGIDLRDADVATFANEAPQGLIRLLEKHGRREPDLLRAADRLWPFVAPGSLGQVRGDERRRAVSAIRDAAEALLAPGLLQPGKTIEVLSSIREFADKVAMPALTAPAAIPDADEEALSGLTP